MWENVHWSRSLSSQVMFCWVAVILGVALVEESLVIL